MSDVTLLSDGLHIPFYFSASFASARLTESIYIPISAKYLVSSSISSAVFKIDITKYEGIDISSMNIYTTNLNALTLYR